MKNLLLLLFLTLTSSSFGQGFDADKIALTNFLKRMYTATPFEGVKIVDDYDHQYLVSVISLDKAKYTNKYIMNRVAQVKAQSQASTFLNGAVITSEFIIKTTEEKADSSEIKTTIETIEKIKEKSVGFVNGLELLTNFDIETGKRTLFVYLKKITEH